MSGMLRTQILALALPLSLAACYGQQATPFDYALGSQRDAQAMERHSAATVQTAETGQESRWNSERGSSGTVSATGQTYADRSQRLCRPLQQNASLPDQDINRPVIACKDEGGTWLVVTPDLASESKEAKSE